VKRASVVVSNAFRTLEAAGRLARAETGSIVTRMSISKGELLQQALRLEPNQRAELAEQLLESIRQSDFESEDLRRAWSDEVERRLEEVRHGRAELIPWEQVQEELSNVVRHRED
jgi:putative addiction module component (TIGR02574 family)